MNALEIVEKKVLETLELQRRRAMWAFQKHAVALAVFGDSQLSNHAIDRINAMADSGDRLIVLSTDSSVLLSLASLHHVSVVCLVDRSELNRLVGELAPDVVLSAPGFVEPEVPESTVLIRMA